MSGTAPTTLDIRLFALFREIAGSDHLRLTLPLPASSAQVLAAVIHQAPALRPFENQMVIAINHHVGAREEMIAADDEVAIFPPVSGG